MTTQDDQILTAKVTSELAFPDKGTQCDCGSELFTLGCMQHEYKHVVGYGCYQCHAQWFLEDDWRTDECRGERLEAIR